LLREGKRFGDREGGGHFSARLLIGHGVGFENLEGL